MEKRPEIRPTLSRCQVKIRRRGKRAMWWWRQGWALHSYNSKKHQGLPATPEAGRLEHGPADTWIADFQPPELKLWFLLFLATQFLLLCYSRSRNLRQNPTSSFKAACISKKSTPQSKSLTKRFPKTRFSLDGTAPCSSVTFFWNNVFL